MNDSPNIIIPTYSGKNYAPLSPLLQLKDKTKPPNHKFTDKIKERWKHFHEMDEAAWKDIIHAGQLIDLFIQGKQLLRRNTQTGDWMITRIKNEDSDSQRAINIMRFYESNCIAKWALSNPDVKVIGGRNDEKAEASAKQAGVIVDHYEEKIYTERFNLREGKLALRWGTYINRYRFDSKLGDKILRDVFGDKMAQLGKGWGRCGDCEHGEEAKAFGYQSQEEGQVEEQNIPDYQCPRCSSNSVMVEPPAREILSTVTGQEETKTGDIACDQLPLPSCRFDLSRWAEESSWFQHRQRTTLSAIRNLIGAIHVKGDSHDYGLDVMEALSSIGSPISGSSSGGDKIERYKQLVTIDEFWMSPDDYADIDIQGDEQTVSGEVLPEGNLAELFPNGMCIVGLNGMNAILGVYAERHSEHIVSGVWHMNPMSGVGSGMNDTVEAQKRLNHFDSKAMAYMDGHSTPAMLFNEDLLTGDKARVLDHPQGAIPVASIAGLDDIRKAVMPLVPGSPAAGMMEYTYNHINNFAQLTSQVTDFSGGLPGVRNTTATGAQITASNSNALFTPPLQMKGFTRKCAAEVTVNLYRNNIKIARKFPLKGKRGRRGAIELSGADLSLDLSFIVVKDSEYPTSVWTKKEDVAQLFQLVGGAQGWDIIKQTDPKMAAWLGAVFGIEAEEYDFDEVEDLNYKRFEQMQAGLQLGMQDPLQFVQLIQPPISSHEPRQTEKAKYWQDLLDEDELQESPMPLRLAVEMVIDEHTAFATGQASVIAAAQGAIQTAGEAPGMIAQGMIQNANQPPDTSQEDTAAAQSHEIATKGMDAQEAEKQRLHDADEAQAARDHELDTIDIQHNNAKELAKMQPKRKAA